MDRLSTIQRGRSFCCQWSVSPVRTRKKAVCCTPVNAAQMTLAHVDGVGYGQIVDHASLPVSVITLLPCQLVVEGRQPRALKCNALQNGIAEDGAGNGCEAPKRVACMRYDSLHERQLFGMLNKSAGIGGWYDTQQLAW